MNELLLNRMRLPITTGTITPGTSTQRSAATPTDLQQPSFAELLAQCAAKNGEGVTFSKHAASRVEQRSIELDEMQLDRLNEGVRIAQQKGLDDTLILIDRVAFIVSARNNRVITTVAEQELTGNVFTNIDGTVII